MKKLLILLAAVIMSMAFVTGCGAGQKAEVSDDPGQEEGDTTTLIQMVPSSTWKYDDSDAYIHIGMNHTYQMCGADMEPGKKITFWKYLEGSDDTMVLYNEFGGEEMTLTAVGDENEYTLKDDKGDTLSQCEKAMNGIYKCGMDSDFIEGDQLSLNAEIYTWLPDYQVQNLKEGDVIAMTDYDDHDIVVEKIEKENDNYYHINGMDLVYDEDAGAWNLADDSDMSEFIGKCTLTDSTVFENIADEHYKDLQDCLKNSGGITAAVEVKGGIAKMISVIE